MAYNEILGDRIRELLVHQEKVEERRMFGGLCFMVNDKMCVGVVKDEMMCRINPDMMDSCLEKPGCRMMDFTGKSMKGFVYVDESGFSTAKDLAYWVELCLDYNPLAKASKKK